MSKKIELDLMVYKKGIKLKKEGNKPYIFDPIRKKYLVLQPEEFVRQLVLLHLMKEEEYPQNRIRVEMMLKVNELKKRCDILIFDKDLKPYLLVECKAANIKITQDTFDQIARYNLSLEVKYLLVTNGLDTYCCEMDYENSSYTFLDEIPSFEHPNK